MGSVAFRALFPPPLRCPACGQHYEPAIGVDLGVCERCWRQITFVVGPSCQCCGKPLVGAKDAGWQGEEKPSCFDCRRRQRSFAWVRAVALYDGALRDYLHAVKYQGQMELGLALGQLMAAHVGLWPGLFRSHVIMPVPMSDAKRARRGYNQAELLAVMVARKLRRPLVLDNLIRARETKKSAGLDPTARAANLQGAFDLVRPAEVGGKRVLLIDDIFTTGATMDECARTILRAGAQAVAGFVLAIGEGWTSAADAGRGVECDVSRDIEQNADTKHGAETERDANNEQTALREALAS